jgi:hypothetical protein
LSEYQYYEFQAVDRPLTPAQQRELRALSTRARITGTSFVNHYDWGDFGGSPARLMERVFDLHLYLANWGTRVFSMRLPRRLVDATALEACFIDDESASWRNAGENIVIDFVRDEVELDHWDDGSGWLAALAPLRADILNGDLRLFYLVWLMAVEAGVAADDAVEPAIVLSPLSGALEPFADFFAIDGDLIDAAIVEEGSPTDQSGNAQAHALIRTLPEREKAALLIDIFDGNDPHLAAGFRRRIRERLGEPRSAARRRTAGDLRQAAREVSERRRRREEEKAAAERHRKELEAEKETRRRLEALKRRGDAVWTDVEAAIVLRNASGYGRAVALLADLQAVAQDVGDMAAFKRRLEEMRERHARKGRFLEKLASLGL